MWQFTCIKIEKIDIACLDYLIRNLAKAKSIEKGIDENRIKDNEIGVIRDKFIL